MPAEKVHLSFLKYVLGVHKKATNIAVRGELGAFPIGIKALHSSYKYYERLMVTESESLLKQALIMAKVITTQRSWWTAVTQHIPTQSADKESTYRSSWIDRLGKSDKLRTLRLFKSSFHFEQYLTHVYNIYHRKSLTRLRISCHTLNIEVGRYSNLPVEDRTCKHCIQPIEDELHFVATCQLYDDARASLYSKIGEFCQNFHALDDNSKLIYLCNAEGPIIREFAKFCNSCFETRKEYYSKN